MTAIITRKALEFWGECKPAPDLAYVVSDHNGRRVVTWADVMQTRRERQAYRLYWKRHVEEWRAVMLWVAYFDQPLLGGWHAFLQDLRSRDWIERQGEWSEECILQLIPLSLPIGSVAEQWRAWKPEFARRFKRRMQCGQPVGAAFLWRRGAELKLEGEK